MPDDQINRQAGFCNICGQTIAYRNSVLIHTGTHPADHEPEEYIPGVQEPRTVILNQDQADRITQFLGLIGDAEGARNVQQMVVPNVPLQIPEPAICHWCNKPCGGTCLGLQASKQMKPDDPAYWMLKDGHATTPVVNDPNCYICRDPEFAQMGLPLCRKCPNCYKVTGKDGHIPADDTVCTICGHDEYEGVDDGDTTED